LLNVFSGLKTDPKYFLLCNNINLFKTQKLILFSKFNELILISRKPNRVFVYLLRFFHEFGRQYSVPFFQPSEILIIVT